MLKKSVIALVLSSALVLWATPMVLGADLQAEQLASVKPARGTASYTPVGAVTGEVNRVAGAKDFCSLYGVPFYAISDWFYGQEWYANYQDPEEYGCVNVWPFEVITVGFNIITDGAIDIDVQGYVLDADLTDPLCPEPGAILCQTPPYTVSIPGAGHWIIALPMVDMCCVYDVYFAAIYILTDLSGSGADAVSEDDLSDVCRSYNDYGNGWEDLVVLWGWPGEMLLWSEGYTEPQNDCPIDEWSNHKMHFPQLPDLEGWDVYAVFPKTLADDWQCSATGEVLDIHFWGSWKDVDGDPETDDVYTPMPWFQLSIHRNIPADADTPWSRPGEQIWFWEGEIPGTPFEPPAMEHWYDPNTGEVFYNDHVPYWRYDFFFDQADPPPEPFFQYQDTIYWLNVSALDIPLPYEWGWKSSRDHFMDDATYTDNPPFGPWYEMYEPPRANWFDVYFNSLGEPEDMGSTNYYGGGWYRYEYWWNMWFYNNPFVHNPKHIWLDFYVDPVGPEPYVEFAINWSTDLWYYEGEPGRPPLPGDDETLYIGRQTFPVDFGPNTIDFWIDDYNPEWVSIDFVATDVVINGWIWHECVPTSMDLAFVITGEGEPEESLYWKASYDDYAPNGMPDIDQKQDSWFKQTTGEWSFCGPVAVANCFKWFDSKYNQPPGAPGDGLDQFPLVRDYLDALGPFIPPATDDHDPWNVDHAATPWLFGATPPPPATPQPFVPGAQPQPSGMPAWGELVERLAWYFNTDGIQTGYCEFSGTDVWEMQAGIEEWFLSEEFEDGSTLADTLYEYTIPTPTFTEVETLVEMCEDVILLLGFWFEDPPGSGAWFRCGGHYVTVAGINSEEFLIAVADPYFDNAEAGGRGRVGNGTLIPHSIPHTDATIHNDEGNVSHDIYSVTTQAVSPGGLWEFMDYPVSLNPYDCERFHQQNVPPEFVPVSAYWNGVSPVFTEVEYAVVISPRNHPPEIGQPDFLEGFVDDTVEYEITGTDPNGDVINDAASITIIPGCGTYSITRTSGHGTSTGTWQVTWYTDTCAVCDTHMVIHDLTDEHGAVGYCTTWVHLSSKRECDPNDPYDCDTLWVECGNMLVPPGGGLVTVDLTIANDESLKTIQVVLSYAGSPTCCDSMPDSENTVDKVFAGSILPDSWITAISIDHQAKRVILGATQIFPDCLPPGKGHLATLTLFGDSCCTIELDTTTMGSSSTGFVECYDPSGTLFYPVCRIDTCHIDRNNPPIIDQPDFLEGYVDDVVQYTIDGTDPDGDVIEDDASIDIQPGCGSGYSITRISGHGTSTGTWEITWNTDGCTPCDTHMVIHDLTDVLGATGYCTTWVHLSQPESLYWKPPYEDYAPNGMVDIDQKQDGWLKFDTDQWSFCGPVAVANCFKWFDSKYNVPPGGPGDGFDQFPLVRDYLDNNPPLVGFDDHDPWNVDHTATPWNPAIGPPPPTPQPFIPGPQTPGQVPPWGELVERLAWYFNTDGIQTGYCEFTGTRVQDMQAGIDAWLRSETFTDGSSLYDTLCEETTARPSFAYVESLVEKCEDVILLLGFWYYGEGPGEQEFIRGDVDANGMVTIDDAVLCMNGPPFLCDDAADVNDDGVWDPSDCDYLVQYIAGGPPPPPPYPDCGLDPTPDGLGCAAFPPCPPGGGGQWYRIGGHYVTVAGVNSEAYRIAFADPFIDAAEFGAPGRIGNGTLIPHSFPHDPTVHNDEGNVSHDIYTVDPTSISPGGDWWLPGYAIIGDPGWWSWNFYAQNVPDEFIDMTAPWDGVSEIFTEVEYCVHISPWDYRGDVNVPGGDGVIDAADIVFLINHVFTGTSAPNPYYSGDCNCDGIIDVADIILLINHVFGGTSAPRCCDP